MSNRQCQSAESSKRRLFSLNKDRAYFEAPDIEDKDIKEAACMTFKPSARGLCAFVDDQRNEQRSRQKNRQSEGCLKVVCVNQKLSNCRAVTHASWICRTDQCLRQGKRCLGLAVSKSAKEQTGWHSRVVGIDSRNAWFFRRLAALIISRCLSRIIRLLSRRCSWIITRSLVVWRCVIRDGWRI